MNPIKPTHTISEERQKGARKFKSLHSSLDSSFKLKGYTRFIRNFETGTLSNNDGDGKKIT